MESDTAGRIRRALEDIGVTVTFRVPPFKPYKPVPKVSAESFWTPVALRPLLCAKGQHRQMDQLAWPQNG
jgi:hypothetical protein